MRECGCSSDKLFNIIAKREKQLGWNKLSHEERIFVMVILLSYEVGNGGLLQYYSNSTGDLAKYIPGALNMINAFQISKMIKKVNSFFGVFGPNQNRIKRNLKLNRFSEDKISYLKSIDEIILEGPEDLEDLLIKYVISTNLDKKIVSDK